MPRTLQTSPHHNTDKILLLFSIQTSCAIGWPQTSHGDGHDPETSDPPPPKHWDYRYAPAHPVYTILGIEPGTLQLIHFPDLPTYPTLI